MFRMAIRATSIIVGCKTLLDQSKLPTSFINNTPGCYRYLLKIFHQHWKHCWIIRKSEYVTTMRAKGLTKAALDAFFLPWLQSWLKILFHPAAK